MLSAYKCLLGNSYSLGIYLYSDTERPLGRASLNTGCCNGMTAVMTHVRLGCQLVDLAALSNDNERSVFVYVFQALRLLRLVRLFLFIKVWPPCALSLGEVTILVPRHR